MPRRSRFPEQHATQVNHDWADQGWVDGRPAGYERAGYERAGYERAGGRAAVQRVDPGATTDYRRPDAGSGGTYYGRSRPRPLDHRRAARERGEGGPAGGGLTEPLEPASKRRKLTRGKRIALISGLVFALLAGLGTIAAGLYLRSVESGIDRVNAFGGVPDELRPEKVSSAMNFLILGSDSRDPEVTGSRTDTIIVAHVPLDRSGAQLISIPRDTWVTLPKSPEGKGGHDAKINAAFSLGGVPLMVQAVEGFTGVRLDNVVLIDFAGFKEIIDALGGVDIEVEKTFTSIHPPRRKFTKGTMHMDGEAALDYARQRYQFADGDFARIRHQQQLIKAVLDKAASTGILANPAQLNSFVRATANAVAVDETLSLLDMAMDLRHLRGNNLTFMTSPTQGTGRVGNQSVVLADAAKVTPFYDAVRRDAVAEFTALATPKK